MNALEVEDKKRFIAAAYPAAASQLLWENIYTGSCASGSQKAIGVEGCALAKRVHRGDFANQQNVSASHPKNVRFVILHQNPNLNIAPTDCYGSRMRAYARNNFDSNIVAILLAFENASGGYRGSFEAPSFSMRQELASMASLRVSRLNGIQASFSLPMQGLSDVLNVSRPQLYKWFDADQAIRLQEESVKRLAEIEVLAKHWRDKTKAPLGMYAHERTVSGMTLLEMLKAPVLAPDEIVRAFDEVVARFGTGPKTRSQRMRDAGYRRRPGLNSLPSDE